MGQRFHIHAPLKNASVDRTFWSWDLAMPNGALPEWVELTEQVGMIEPGARCRPT